MPVPLFGWSAGDIVVSIKILYHVADAFSESGGAKDQYAETSTWLRSFAEVLERVKEHVDDNPTAKYTENMRQQVSNIRNHSGPPHHHTACHSAPYYDVIYPGGIE
jgi:hypothetical protein